MEIYHQLILRSCTTQTLESEISTPFQRFIKPTTQANHSKQHWINHRENLSLCR